MQVTPRFLATLMLLGLFTTAANAFADSDSHPFAKHHYVLQVSEADPARWNLALNNAQNLINHYGPSGVDVVIVAYGPGLKMLLKKSKVEKRVSSISSEGVSFDACHTTMKKMAKKLGHLPVLNPVASVVPGGVIRVGELEGKGYAYIKP